MFGFKLTSDNRYGNIFGTNRVKWTQDSRFDGKYAYRYVVSVSNKIITFDVTTGDLSR